MQVGRVGVFDGWLHRWGVFSASALLSALLPSSDYEKYQSNTVFLSHLLTHARKRVTNTHRYVHIYPCRSILKAELWWLRRQKYTSIGLYCPSPGHALTAQTSTHPIIHCCRFDTNNNGRLEIEEFLQFVHRSTQTKPRSWIGSHPSHSYIYWHCSRRKLRKKNALHVFEKLVCDTPRVWAFELAWASMT